MDEAIAASQGDISNVTAQRQQASGATLFWALAAIVVNAMLQPSFSGYMMSGDLFRGTVWPHRSSPVVCIVDALMDARLVVQRYRKPRSARSKHEVARSTTMALRLAVVTLGVVPQAIQIFSTRGIPLSQTLAAIYLASSLISMIRAVHLEDADKDLTDLVASFDTLNPGDPNPRFNIERAEFTVAISTLAPHFLWLGRVWMDFDCRLAIPASDNVARVAHLIGETASLLIVIYTFHYVVWFLLVGKSSPIPFRPVIIVMGFIQSPGLLRFLHSPGNNMERFGVINLLGHAVICSCALAFAVCLLVEKLRGLRSAQTSGTEVTVHEEGTELADRDVAAGEAHTGEQPASDERADDPTPDALPPYSEVEAPSAESIHTDSPPFVQGPAGGPPPTYATATEEELSPEDGSTSPRATDGEPPSDEKVGWFWHVLMYLIGAPIILMFILLMVADMDPFSKHDEEVAQQAATEEGREEPRPSSQENKELFRRIWALSISHYQKSYRPTPREIAWLLVKVIAWPFRLALRVMLVMIWRIAVSSYGIHNHTWKWTWRKVGSRSKDVLWIAFGILNAATAAIYYLAIFDGRGTTSPSWTDAFG